MIYFPVQNQKKEHNLENTHPTKVLVDWNGPTILDTFLFG